MDYVHALRKVYTTEINSPADFLSLLDEKTASLVKTKPWFYNSSSSAELLYYFTKEYYQISGELQALRQDLATMVASITDEIEAYILKTLISGNRCVIDPKDWAHIDFHSLERFIVSIAKTQHLVLIKDNNKFVVVLALPDL